MPAISGPDHHGIDVVTFQHFLMESRCGAVPVAVVVVHHLFRELILFTQLIWLGVNTETVSTAAAKIHWSIVLFTPALGGLLVFSYAQYLAKAAVVYTLDEIKDRKKSCRRNN